MAYSIESETKQSYLSSDQQPNSLTVPKVSRRDVLKAGLSLSAIVTLPTGLVYAANAENDKNKIENTAKTIEINSQSIPDNYRKIYIASKKDEKNIEKRTHRGLILLTLGVGSLIGRLFLNDQEQ